MADMCTYSSSDGKQVVNLDGDGTWVGTAPAMRGRAWSYSLGASRISAVQRKAREVTIKAAFTDPEKADLLRHLADRDVANSTPGTLRVGEWFQRAYITACDPGTIFGDYHTADLTAVLLDGAWSRESTISFGTVAEPGGAGLDLPYDLPYDLGAPRPVSTIDAGRWGECPAKLEIHGPCESPSLRIGGTLYSVDCIVPTGGTLTIDGIAKTAIVTDSYGTATDVFKSAMRGTGKGGGSYAFQPVPAGQSTVEWDGTFAFDLTLYEQEGEPPWAS